MAGDYSRSEKEFCAKKRLVSGLHFRNCGGSSGDIGLGAKRGSGNGSMTNSKLVQTATGILRKPGISKIAYELNGLLVTGTRYSMVAAAILDGRISCEAVSSFSTSKADSLAPLTKIGAKYDPDTNTMFFSSESYGSSNAYEQSVVLHEATHAMFDLYASCGDPGVLAINDESAAVLAQAHFFRLCAPNESMSIHRFSMQIDGPGETSLALVDKMMADTGDFVRNTDVYRLKPTQTEKLRTAVAQEWNLVRIVESDGVRDRSGILDVYDGVSGCCRR
jgi:hypothetical protein